MWIVVVALVLVVGYLATKSPGVVDSKGEPQALPPNDTVTPLGASIPSPASAVAPTASQMFKNALNATYLEAPVERGVSRENTVIRAAQATEETTPGAGFPDGGKQLATMKPVPSAHFQTFPDKAKQLAKRIKL